MVADHGHTAAAGVTQRALIRVPPARISVRAARRRVASRRLQRRGTESGQALLVQLVELPNSQSGGMSCYPKRRLDHAAPLSSVKRTEEICSVQSRFP